MAVFGLPIWFLTTSTYRASLPFDSISEISSMRQLEIQINIDLVYFNKNDESTRKKYEEEFLNELNSGIK